MNIDELVRLVWENYNYWASIILMLVGFFGVINGTNLIKKLIGLAIFQTSVLLFYISASVVKESAVPILKPGEEIIYTNPLPHVLMLTAIVVGVATLSVGLALVVRIKESYGSIEEDVVLAKGRESVAKSMQEYDKARGVTK